MNSLGLSRRSALRSALALSSSWWVPAAASAVPASGSREAVRALTHFLHEGGGLGAVADQPFAVIPLRRADAEQARALLVASREESRRAAREAEFAAGELVEGELRMPFFLKVFGDEPPQGHSVFFSLHGGGGAPAAVNDGQWRNQQQLYTPAEGLYVAPRAPTNTWNLWHQPHIDRLFDRLIEMLVVTQRANRNRVYLMGYSAGGDGVYQLAPRMADRWAAAAMMAGHPNDASPLSLRNLPFSLQVGGRDTAYNRHAIAADWEKQLDALRQADPTGYEHFVKIYPEHGHWMQREDAVALPWMAKHTRNPVPRRVVWEQDDVLHNRSYWLAVDEENRKARSTVVAEIDGQQITVESKDLTKVTLHLDDRLVDLDRPLRIIANGRPLPEVLLERSIATLAHTLAERGDAELCFSARHMVPLSTDALSQP